MKLQLRRINAESSVDKVAAIKGYRALTRSPLDVAMEDINSLIDHKVDSLTITARKDLTASQIEEGVNVLRSAGIEAIDVAHEQKVKIDSELTAIVMQLIEIEKFEAARRLIDIIDMLKSSE